MSFSFLRVLPPGGLRPRRPHERHSIRWMLPGRTTYLRPRRRRLGARYKGGQGAYLHTWPGVGQLKPPAIARAPSQWPRTSRNRARYIMQHATEVLLLPGLPMFASAVSITTHHPQTWRRRFERSALVFILHTSPPHIDAGRARMHVKVFRQPPTPSTMRQLVLGFDEHFASMAIMLVTSIIPHLQFSLDQWN
jgi:hypothetical protein